MQNASMQVGRDFFAHLAARDPVNRRLRRLFERGVIAEVTDDYATVNVGRREDGSDILLEDVPIVSGYNPAVGDWVTLRYDGGSGGAPMVFGPSVANDTEEPPSTSSQEVIDARNSTRYGAHASLDARLEDHEQDSIDPHGESLTQTTKVRTPLIDAAGNLNLLPTGALLIGEVGGSATSYRPMVWGANPVVGDQTAVSFKATLSACPSGSYMTLLATEATFASNDATKWGRGVSGTIYAKEANSPAGIIGYEGQAAVYDTAAPAQVIGALGHVRADSSYSGTLPKMTGVIGTVRNSGSGHVTLARYLAAEDLFAWSGPVDTLIGLDIPTLTKGSINYLMRLGTGTILANGNLTLQAGDASITPLALKAADSQSTDLQQWQDSTGNVLARVSKEGWLGVGGGAGYPVDVYSSIGPLVRLSYVTSDGAPAAVQLRTCRGNASSPNAIQSGDRIANVQGVGYKATGWALATGVWRIIASESFTDTANGTRMDWAVTRIGTIANFVAMTLDQTGYLGLGQIAPATQLELEENQSISVSLSDGYAATLTFDPAYSGQGQLRTISRHNYLDVQNVSALTQASVTDACVFRFDAAANTHKAVDGQTTKQTPSAVSAWVKININGTIHFVPAYTSKTS